jgi:hypothetical protein
MDKAKSKFGSRQISQNVSLAVQELLNHENRKSVTVFMPRNNEAKFRVRAARVSEVDKRVGYEEFRVTIGRPNYEEREFLKLCRKAKTQPRKISVI